MVMVKVFLSKPPDGQGGVEIMLNSFLTSELLVAEWSASGAGRIGPEQRAKQKVCSAPEATEDKNCRPGLNQTTTCWLCSPYARHLTD
jgi:hypothetical protein